jgi:hypothetical protein
VANEQESAERAEDSAGPLNSAASSVVIRRSAQPLPGAREEARQLLRKLADHVNSGAVGQAAALCYEEAFGTRERLHLLLHLESISSYDEVTRLADDEIGDGWNRLFQPASVQDVVLMPQFWGMYGARVDGTKERQSTVYRSSGNPVALPGARHQTDQTDDQLLHSANSGVVMHRSGQMVYDLRSEARAFGREVAESINSKLPGECSVYVYEEAFGAADRLHWLIHLKDMTTYMRLLALHVRDEEVRDIYFRQRIAAEKGGGTWARMFVEGSMADIALVPLR